MAESRCETTPGLPRRDYEGRLMQLGPARVVTGTPVCQPSNSVNFFRKNECTCILGRPADLLIFFRRKNGPSHLRLAPEIRVRPFFFGCNYPKSFALQLILSGLWQPMI